MEALYQTDYLAKKIMITASLRCRDMNWTEKGCEVILSSNELREMSGVLRSSLKHLEHAVKKLTETSVTVKNPQDPKHWIIFNYLPKGEYKNGVLTLLINSEMKPFIQDLQKNFTQYHIENIKPLKSGYSIRIFELLKMSAYKGNYRIKVDELRKMFGLDKKYSEYNNLKQRVIEPAKRELKQHCDIYFDYTEIKLGNKVNEIEFKIYKQSREFTEIEDILEAKAKDIEFREVSPESTGGGLYQDELNFDKAKVSYTELGQKLIKLGFMGDSERFIQEEGRDAIENTLKTIESVAGVNNPIGLLRERLKAFKLQRELINQEQEAKKKKEEADQKLAHEKAIIAEARIKESEKRDLENDEKYSKHLPEFYEFCMANSFNDFLKDDFINEFKQKFDSKETTKFSELGGIVQGCFLEWLKKQNNVIVFQ